MTKITRIILIIFIASLFSCSKGKKENASAKFLDNKTFEFDKIEHYSSIQNHKIDSITSRKEEPLSKFEKEYFRLLNDNYPTSLTDSSFFKSLMMPHIKVDTISKEGLIEFKKKFNNKMCDYYANKACVPIYDDIYIFRLNSKITGIAKVCYQCEIIYFLDSNTSWERFGDSCEVLESLKTLK